MQCLYIRLYWRKGPWFRLHELNYSEFQIPMDGLIQGDSITRLFFMPLLDSDSKWVDIQASLNLLTVQEIQTYLSTWQQSHVNSPPMKRTKRLLKSKHALIDHLDMLWHSDDPGFRETLFSLLGPCISLTEFSKETLKRAYGLCYLFKNSEMDLRTIAQVRDMQYPSYVVDHIHPLFQDISTFDAYLYAKCMSDSVEALLLADNDAEMIFTMAEIALENVRIETIPSTLPLAMHRFTTLYVYARISWHCVKWMERHREYTKAIYALETLIEHVPQSLKRGKWWLRWVMNLEHKQWMNRALEVAEKALEDTIVCGGERLALQSHCKRLSVPPRKWRRCQFPTIALDYFKAQDAIVQEMNPKPSWCLEHPQGHWKTVPTQPYHIPEIVIGARPINCQMGEKSRFVHYALNEGQSCTVEELALEYYTLNGGWQGVHCEGGMVYMIFGLLCWSVIYMDIPHVFHSPFQSRPLDFDTSAFFKSRISAFQQLFIKLSTVHLKSRLEAQYHKYYGTMGVGMNWKYRCEDLCALVECIGKDRLLRLLIWLGYHPAQYWCGMPDLILWQPHLQQVQFVEVKGPRDKLSFIQEAWLQWLYQMGISCAVCKVSDQVPCGQGWEDAD